MSDQLEQARLARLRATWPTVRLKHIARLSGGGTPSKDNEAFWTHGTVPWASPKDMKRRIIRETEDYITEAAVDGSATSYVEAGCPLIVVRSGILRHTLPVAIAGCRLTLNQDMKAFRLNSRLDGQFLAYWIEGQSTDLLLEWRQFGATVESIDSTRMMNARIGLPDSRTQKKIIEFLDYEIARIDQLIEKKKRFLELADERWNSTIDDAICGRGLKIDRISVEHLAIDAIPAHWRLMPLKHLTDDDRQIMYGIVLPGPNVEDGVMIVKGGDVKPARMDPDRLCKTTFEIERGYTRSRLEAGDLVIAIRGGIGDIEIVPPAIGGANLTQDAARIAPRKGVHNVWLRYALQAPSVFAPLDARALGAAVRGINIFDLKRVRVPTPPTAEQFEIARLLDRKAHQIAVLRHKVAAHSEAIREFRSALITAAVTGQIDVAAWRKHGETDRRLDRIEEEMSLQEAQA